MSDFDYTKLSVTNSDFICTLRPRENSEWRCYLFGGTNSEGILWQPIKGKEPNWFWRKMQFLCFGNRWVKEEIIK